MFFGSSKRVRCGLPTNRESARFGDVFLLDLYDRPTMDWSRVPRVFRSKHKSMILVWECAL